MAEMDKAKDDSQLKKRVIGATVLVALIVIFVPMLFERQGTPPPTSREHPALRGTGVSQMIALQEETPASRPRNAPSMSRNNTPPAAQGGAFTAAYQDERRVPRVPELPPPSLPDASPSGGSAPARPAPDVQVTEEPVLPPTVEAIPAEREPSTPAAPPPAVPIREETPAGRPSTPTAEARPAGPRPGPLTSRWVVQLGAFSQQSNASALAERLRRRGYAAFVQEMGMGSGRLFRVRIGPQAGRQEAESLRNQLRRELQMDGQVRPY